MTAPHDQKDVYAAIVRHDTQIDALTKDVRSLAESVQKIADSLALGNRTNWGVIFTGVGVLVSVMILYVQPFAESQKQIQEEVRTLSRGHVAHIGDGHPTRIEQRFDAMNKRMEDYAAANARMGEEQNRSQDADRSTIEKRLEGVESQMRADNERARAYLDAATWRAVTRKE